MPKRNNEKKKDNFFGFLLTAEIMELKELNLSQKVILAYIYSMTNSCAEFYVGNNGFKSKLNICKGTVSSAIKKLKKLNYIKQVHFDGRDRRIVQGEAVKKLHANAQKWEGGLLKIGIKPTKKREYIINSNKKGNNKNTPSKSKMIEYDKKSISEAIRKNIQDLQRPYLRLINEETLLECKKAYLRCKHIQGVEWDDNQQNYLPPLLYKISSNYFPLSVIDEHGDERVRGALIKTFSTLVNHPSKFTNTIRSYFNMYNYWIDEIKREKKDRGVPFLDNDGDGVF